MLESIIENIPLAIIVKDILDNYKIINWNQKAEQIFETESSNILGKNAYDLLPKNEADIIYLRDQKIVEEGLLVEISEEYIEKKNKEIVIVKVKIFPLATSDSPEPKYLLYIYEDITDAVNYNKKILYEKNKFESLVNGLNKAALVSIANIQGEIIYANEKFCKTSGYSKEQLIGKNHRILKSGKHPDSFYKDMWDTISSGKVWYGDICNRKKDNSIYWVESVITPIEDENNIDKKQNMSVRFDITTRKKSETEIQHLSKLKDLGEISAGITHEIYTPITIIKNSTNTLINVIHKPEEFKSKINFINKSIDRILSIADGLKRYSRKTEKKIA